MTDEQRHALDLAAYLNKAAQARGDAVTVGISDAETIARALRAYAATLAAP